MMRRTPTSTMLRAGQILMALLVVLAAAAPLVSPNPPDRRYPDRLYAPPTRIHVWNDGPAWPFIYRQRLISRIERRFAEDRSRPVPLEWFTDGRLVTTSEAPLLLLGADAYGRDVFSRLVHGARVSLALALTSGLCALALGAALGAVAGYAGGWADAAISRSSEFLLVLPTMYVVLVLRAVLPIVLDAGTIFILLTLILTALGWPIVARGTRAIVMSEREREYVLAARAVGLAPHRILLRHVLPATRSYLGTQLTLLVPAFILAEATLSYVGFGFPPGTASWGTMLQDAANVLLVADAPWLLAPAGAIFLAVLATNLMVQARGRAPVQLDG